MSIVDKLADKAVKNYSKLNGVEKAVDPALIFSFIELIIQAIGLVKKCKSTPEEGLTVFKSPTLLQRARLRRNTKKNLDRADKQYGKDVTEALIKTGSEMTVEEMKAAYKEVDEYED